MAERAVYFVAPWDLHRDLACVPRHPGASVLFVESVAKGSALPFHRQKLVLVLSAMHHFAEELRAEGHDVTVLRAPTYVEGIRRHVEARGASAVVAMRPREWGLSQAMEAADFGVPLTLHDDGGEGGHFLLSREDVRRWMEGRKQLRMQTFYTFMRKRTGYLMTPAGKPVGDKYSFDADNREHARGVTPPDVPSYPPDELTRSMMERVAAWPAHFASVEGFDWPVTRDEALRELDDFLASRAEGYGRYQDAMLTGSRFLFHARISVALNLSLLSPKEVCDAVADAHEDGRMPLAAAEGFIRQVIGWREFIRAVYLHRMPALRTANLLGAERALPAMFWEPERTDLHCMRATLEQVRDTGYAHHIQRLMVLGNFALLAGVAPLDISHWFWAAFVDAYEWVELPNVHGMAVFADNAFTTKPYAASGSYIDRMSDYCKHCRYKPKQRTGDDACPFNAMFWNFLRQHRARLEANPRLRVLYRTWDKWGDEEQTRIVTQAERYVATLRPADHGWTFDDDAC